MEWLENARKYQKRVTTIHFHISETLLMDNSALPTTTEERWKIYRGCEDERYFEYLICAGEKYHQGNDSKLDNFSCLLPTISGEMSWKIWRKREKKFFFLCSLKWILREEPECSSIIDTQCDSRSYFSSFLCCHTELSYVCWQCRFEIGWFWLLCGVWAARQMGRKKRVVSRICVNCSSPEF